ncbi:MAG TPA: PLP-dependent aminotransferase family protein [Terriglobales bacterium]|nr:PLP-dependent aminotransferase family protein [Terriglobales bacterium]
MPPIPTRRLRRGDLYQALRAAILDGTLAPGERLPSTRQAALDYGISRGTMEEVFAQLTEEGFLERAVGKGTFVAATVSRLTATPPPRCSRKRKLPKPSRRGSSVSASAACREPEELRPFNAGIADTSEFPWQQWHRLEIRAARELGRESLTFADPRGFPQLRAAIARYLAQFRGIRCRAEQVIVFNSAQQALNALAVLLLDAGDRVWLEDPCYLGARAAWERLGSAAVVPVPVDEHGIRVEAGLRLTPRARLAYVTPSHQYPTGVVLSLERRLALLEWAARAGSWIIEDDYDGEFRHHGQPLTALYSLDSQARVIYVGTLNKSMFVSLRLAYAVVPEELLEPLANIRTQFDGFTPAPQQMAMSLFMDEGHFSSHLRHMRGVYAGKRAKLIEGLEPLRAEGWSWPEIPAGMHLLTHHQNGQYVRTVARKSSLDLALLSSYRIVPARGDGLLLRFGALSLSAIEPGIARLVETAAKVHRS